MEKYQEYLKENIRQNLRACQLRQLEILKEIDRICQKHHIEYWLDGGSLLGAVRMVASSPGTTTSTSPCP